MVTIKLSSFSNSFEKGSHNYEYFQCGYLQDLKSFPMALKIKNEDTWRASKEEMGRIYGFS